ncbi:hypothetical protein BBJ28_00024613, partial [Nothophytophthora sp. Chile5]
MPPKGKTSGAKAPAKKTAAKPKSSSAKAKAKANTPSSAIKPVAAVSASADAQGAAAPETLVASPARRADEPSTPKAKTWGDEFLADLGMTVNPESSPEPNDALRHDQAPAKDADLESEDKTSVPTQSGHSSAAASSPPPVQRKLTRQAWKAQRAGRASAQSTGAASAARKRPASSSPLKETGASRRTRHVPAKHGELFYQSEDSHDESCKGGPSEEGEIAQPHQAEEVSNLLDKQQEDYLSARQSQFTDMRTPTPGRPVQRFATARREFETLEAAQQRDRRHLQEAQSNLAHQRDRIRSLEAELGIGRLADPNASGNAPRSLASLRLDAERHDREIYEIHDRIGRRVTYDEFSQMRNDVDHLTQSLSGMSLGHRGPEQRQYALKSYGYDYGQAYPAPPYAGYGRSGYAYPSQPLPVPTPAPAY